MEEEEPSLESLLGSLPPAALQLLMDVEQRASRAEALALQALQEKQVQFAEKRAAEARLKECEGQIQAMEGLVKQAVDMSENVAELATRLRNSEENRMRWQREALEKEQQFQALQEVDTERQRRVLELEAQLKDTLASSATEAGPGVGSVSGTGEPAPGHGLGWRLGSRILEEHFKRQSAEAARVTAEVHAAAEAERDTVLRYEETIRKLTEELEACSSDRDALGQQNSILRGRLRHFKEEGRAPVQAKGTEEAPQRDGRDPPPPALASPGIPWQPVHEGRAAEIAVRSPGAGIIPGSGVEGASSEGELPSEEQSPRDPTRNGFGGMGSAELDARSYGACSNDLAEEDLEGGDEPLQPALRNPQPRAAPRAKARIDVRAVELDATQQELEALKEWKDQAQRAIVELQRQLVVSKEEMEETGPLPQGVLEAVHAMRPFDGGASAPSSQRRPDSGDVLVPANPAAIALAANTALERPTTAPDSQHRATVTFWDSRGSAGAMAGARGGEPGLSVQKKQVAEAASSPHYKAGGVDIVPGQDAGDGGERPPPEVSSSPPGHGSVGDSGAGELPVGAVRPQTRRGLAVPHEPEVFVVRAASAGHHGGGAQQKASRRARGGPPSAGAGAGAGPDFMRPTLSHSASLQSHLGPGERPTSFADSLRRWKTQLRGPRGARRRPAKAPAGAAPRGTRV